MRRQLEVVFRFTSTVESLPRSCHSNPDRTKSNNDNCRVISFAPIVATQYPGDHCWVPRRQSGIFVKRPSGSNSIGIHDQQSSVRTAINKLLPFWILGSDNPIVGDKPLIALVRNQYSSDISDSCILQLTCLDIEHDGDGDLPAPASSAKRPD